MTAHEVRRRAGQGAALIVARSLVLRGLGVVVTAVLARFLVPSDFGKVAFGTAFVALAAVISDGGIGATLIRRRGAPGRADLEALLGLQLLVSVGLLSITFAVGWPLGQIGHITAVMASAVPIAALRVPVAIPLERSLSYRPLVCAEIAETVAFAVWAIVGVAIGWGVWALATAAVVRAIAGTVVLFGASRVRPLLPRFEIKRLRAHLAFGVRFQLNGLTSLIRDQGLNVGVAAVGGLSVLGIWTLASRIMQVPFVVFSALWRVSYPTMSRLRDAGEDLKPLIERAVSGVAVVTGLILAPLVGSAPALVPALLGERWNEVSQVLPFAAAGLMVSGPVSVSTAGYLFAAGDATTVLRSSVSSTIAWSVVALPLVPSLGAVAMGVGWCVGAWTEAAILGRRTSALLGARLLRSVVPQSVAAAVGASGGWIVASSTGRTLVWALVAAIVAVATYLGVLARLQRHLLKDTLAATRDLARLSFAKAAPA
jgi:O-antigen/teichoic acid export membrane protein